ncbi:hypothetical protein [Ulvibacterium marinum]|uniref:Uncharacterized protein n=1 Tax=Ulvibacterium marinum TaxID=2419782 RepID=A0A3B0CEC9_9FLAO|nr:hypothetical protein [Ulvibacterium marinum]RKN82299.1 hypothetical protein D7Z94_00090 [Ulvibacterium marinum]
MKKLLFVLLILVFGCSDDKEEDLCFPDGVIIDLIVRNFFVELVSADGENLIENGTFKSNEIVLRYKESKITGSVFENVEGLENVITMNLFGDDGDNTFLIDLSMSVTDTLVLNLTKTVNECGIADFSLNSATYNGLVKTLLPFNEHGDSEKIVVIK